MDRWVILHEDFDADDTTNAEKIMKALCEIKSENSLLRKGLTLYELVKADDDLQEMREGKAHIIGGK